MSAPVRLVVVNEHGGGKGAPTGDLVADFLVDWTSSGGTSRFISESARYVPGALRLGRILNQLRLGIRVFALLLLERITTWITGKNLVVISTTSPPLFHIPLILFAKCIGALPILWLMDAHPENEVRLIQKSKKNLLLVPILRTIDTVVTKMCMGVIALDGAMSASLLTRTGYRGPVIVANPWVTFRVPAKLIRTPLFNGRRANLIYAGNYGFVHDLSPLANALRSGVLSPDSIKITFVGMSSHAATALSKLFNIPGLVVSFLERRKEFKELEAFFEDSDLGLVSLNEYMEGVACPSKAYTYISCGLPILYIGPNSSLSSEICKSGYGITLEQAIQFPIPEWSNFTSKAGTTFEDPRSENINKMIDFVVRIGAGFGSDR